MTISIIEKDFKIAKAILKDASLKKTSINNDKQSIELLKVLRAREENFEFELELAERICGDNPNYPYRSSYYITQFFENLGLNYQHDGSTRRFWIRNVLLEIDVSEIAKIIQVGLFRKKDYKNKKFRTPENEHLSDQEFFTNALIEFRKFIDDSSKVNEPIHLSQILNLHPSIDLFLKNNPQTKDEELNDLVIEAKSRFLNNADLHIALEKLWDAFERIKTYYDSDKKKSAEKLIDYLAIDLDRDIIYSEFMALTKIGNDYRIRHHERNKKEIVENNQINYLFFRMLSLIDLAITTIMGLEEEL